MFRLESSFLNQVHDRGGECDKQRRIPKENKRRVDVNPVTTQYGRNGCGRIVKQICHEGHDKDQGKGENTQGSDTILRVGDKKTQRGQRSEKRKRFVLLRQGQVTDIERSKQDRSDMKDESCENCCQSRPKKRLFFFKSS